LDSNRLVKLPPSFAYLSNQLAVEFSNNPALMSPPLAVCKRGVPAIREYIKRHELIQDNVRQQRVTELKIMEEVERVRKLAEHQQNLRWAEQTGTPAQLYQTNPAFDDQRDQYTPTVYGSDDDSSDSGELSNASDTESVSNDDSTLQTVNRSGRSVSLLPDR
jgi:hypothetical protein